MKSNLLEIVLKLNKEAQTILWDARLYGKVSWGNIYKAKELIELIEKENKY